MSIHLSSVGRVELVKPDMRGPNQYMSIHLSTVGRVELAKPDMRGPINTCLYISLL